MKIVAVDETHLDDLYGVYRQVTAGVPHCRFTPSLTHFRASLSHPAQPATQVWVAEHEARAVGFVALLDQGSAPDGKHAATISALFVQDEAAGQALLDACLQQARTLNIQQLLAFASEHHVCPILSYNAGWDGLSDRMSLVGRLLAKNRFTPYHRELHMTCTGEFYPPPPSGVAMSFTLGERVNTERQQVLAAMRGDQQAGICVYSTLADLSDDPQAARCGYIWGLYTAPEFRQQGIARQLLTTAMAQLYHQHCTSCWLTTTVDNWEAQPLYLAFGFEIVDVSASFRRTLVAD